MDAHIGDQHSRGTQGLLFMRIHGKLILCQRPSLHFHSCACVCVCVLSYYMFVIKKETISTWSRVPRRVKGRL